MPYIKPEDRGKYIPVIQKMERECIVSNESLVDILFSFCEKHVKPSYNNYKNYIGELRQCAKEIQRRKDDFDLKNPIPKIKENPLVEEVVQMMADVGVKANGDLNFILFGFCRYYVESGSEDEFCSILMKVADKIEEVLLAPYEDEKIKENGDV